MDRNNASLVILTLSMLALASAAMADDSAPKPRVSTDGVEYPSVVGEQRFKTMLPLVRDKLGATPEEFKLRIFDAKKSKTLLERHSERPLDCDWFALGLANADIVGLDLTDGRISRIKLIFKTAQEKMPPTVSTELKKISQEATDRGRHHLYGQERHAWHDAHSCSCWHPGCGFPA
jgi:hypothetical protein